MMPSDVVDADDLKYAYEKQGIWHVFNLPGFWMFSGEDIHPDLTTGGEFIDRVVAQWCFDRLGAPYAMFVTDSAGLVAWSKPSGRWATTPGGAIIIVTDEDAMEFRLRWC